MTVLRVVILRDQIRERLNFVPFSSPPDDWPTEVKVIAQIALASTSLVRPIKEWLWAYTFGHEREIRRATDYCPVRDGDRWNALEISFEKDSDAVAFKLRWSDEVEIETLQQTV